MNRNSFQLRRTGFTLLELLVVVGIAGVLMVLAVPLFQSVHEASNLRRASRGLVDQLNMARQLALSRNCQVEVRFYETAATGEERFQGQLRASAIAELDSSGKVRRGKPVILPGAVVFNGIQDHKYSPLIGANLQPNPPADDPSLPGGKYAAFRFNPSGETNLRPLDGPRGDGWYVTLVNLRSTKDTTLPDNYVTISVDALTGRARVYQP